MKRLRYILTGCVLAGALASCDMITYEGEFNTDGFYKSNNRAYFYFEKESDTLRSYSFSLRPVEELEYTFEVPVRMTGVPPTKATKIKLVKVADASTAEVNTHYLELPEYVEFPANSYETTFKVTVLKSNLPTSENEKKRLVLRLEDTSDLVVAFPEDNEIILSMDNYFDDAELQVFWDTNWSSFMGLYNRQVFLKFLEYYEWNITELWNTAFQSKFYINWARTVRYFDEHPELGISIELPDWFDLPYKE